MEIFTKTYANGSSQVITNDVVQGTAQGSNGQAYRFVYRAKITERHPTNAGAPVAIQMLDSFVMNGAGGVKGTNVGFHWRWTYLPPAGPFDVLPLANLRVDFTKGDPFACDPI